TYVRDSFWKGREFDSLAQMQQAAVTWSTEVAGLRYSPGFFVKRCEFRGVDMRKCLSCKEELDFSTVQ
ncbi:hypothetical protein ABDZ15_20270, partial [Mycobacterium canetti]|uniref:hypothetical protein n=1 Tax=Mycobacterium canetti TaxID=78331 RepID=UPI0032E39CC5